MKFSTLLYIRDLLEDNYKSTVKREDEAKEQADLLLPGCADNQLAQEITYKWQCALSDRVRAEEAIEDYLKHQWR